MRSATEISLAEDFSSRHLQAYSVYDNNDINRRNLSEVGKLVGQLESGAGTPDNNGAVSARVWKDVAVANVLRFIRALELPQTEFSALEAGGASLLSAYIEDRAGAELKNWDIAMPFVSQPSHFRRRGCGRSSRIPAGSRTIGPSVGGYRRRRRFSAHRTPAVPRASDRGPALSHRCR
jgi:hypothetical protein